MKPDRESRFRALYADTYADVLRFAQRRVHPSHAEDVVADTFLAAWRRMDVAPRRHGDARAWLFGIARNCLLNTRRGLGRQDALAVRLAEVRPVAGGAEDAAITWRLDLATAWRGLSAAEQETLALTVFDGLDSKQAARVLGITATSYRLRLLRARRALRRGLGPDPAEESLTILGLDPRMETRP
ncbi:DNA-directed RNA polymerase sigma-70 factor [Actinoplanes lobatus]|uniref:DNA-directed RNA polymerase sigma-70 factor n=1 Tax=Actinoplanes lobatus TaxID=113568 RepID=A0ABQ4AVE9_9ACTN|nr:DNA-directed RNA polymerase sigma-70 factor [Actinoplanes lobatus]GIE44918.1 DNA-directed RNA polymerase sigma-70 factor [Actinoplanes lobatus]